MKKLFFLSLKYLSLGALVMSVSIAHAKEKPQTRSTQTIAEWTVAAYVQADNSLASFADYNITDMQAGMTSADSVNMLVQWDKPADNKTWRYRIVPGNRIEDGSLSTEMGIDPVAEIVAFMQWAQTNYPAKHYVLILWNHGSGIEDFKNPLAKTRRLIKSWIQIPGSSISLGDRGILYDDSQGTVLTNQGLTSALSQIKVNLGKNIDVLGMDACLMAMLEVGYQIKDCVDYFVGSQQTEPGNGWAYSKWLAPLTTNPTSFGGRELAQAIVAAYGTFYHNVQSAQDFTQSAVQISALNDLTNNINQFVTNVAACKVANPIQTKTLIKAARKQALEFYMPEYIDLYSFYLALNNKLAMTSPKSERILTHAKASRPAPKPHSKDFVTATGALKQTVQQGMKLILAAVAANAVGPEYANAKGISIYYPTTGTIHESYPLTLFANNTNWMNFLNEYSL